MRVVAKTIAQLGFAMVDALAALCIFGLSAAALSTIATAAHRMLGKMILESSPVKADAPVCKKWSQAPFFLCLAGDQDERLTIIL